MPTSGQAEVGAKGSGSSYISQEKIKTVPSKDTEVVLAPHLGLRPLEAPTVPWGQHQGQGALPPTQGAHGGGPAAHGLSPEWGAELSFSAGGQRKKRSWKEKTVPRL